MSDDRAQAAAADRAAADLAALDADRAALADRVAAPRWFGPALGLLLFVFIASNAADSVWVTVPAVLGFGVGIGLLVNHYRRTTGVWVHTPFRVLASWSVFVLLVLGPAFYGGDERPWLYLVSGAVLGVAVAVLSHRWTRAWQRELREGV